MPFGMFESESLLFSNVRAFDITHNIIHPFSGKCNTTRPKCSQSVEGICVSAYGIFLTRFPLVY